MVELSTVDFVFLIKLVMMHEGLKVVSFKLEAMSQLSFFS